MISSQWKHYEQALEEAVRIFWEVVEQNSESKVEVFGLCINDAGEGIEPHVIFYDDFEEFAKEDGTSLEDARINHLLDRMIYTRFQSYEQLFEKATALYVDIEPADLDDEAAWERIHKRHERIALTTLKRLKKEGVFEQQNPSPLLMLQKTTGLSSAESEYYLAALNSKDAIEALFGPESEALGAPMIPCGPVNRDIRFRALRLSPDGVRVAQTGWDNEVQIWKLGNWSKPEQVKRFRSGRAESLAWMSDDELLILMTSECWYLNLRTGKRKCWAGSRQGLKKGMDLDVDLNRRHVWIATENQALQCFSLQGELLHEIKIEGDWMRSVCVSPDGRWIGIAADDHGVSIFDAESYHQVVHVKGEYSKVCFSDDSNLFMAASSSEKLPMSQPVWDVSTGSLVSNIPLSRLHGGQGEDFISLETASCGIFLPKSSLVAVAQGYGEFSTVVKIWDIQTYKCLASFSDMHECISAMAFCSKSKDLLVTGEHHRGASLYRCPISHLLK